MEKKINLEAVSLLIKIGMLKVYTDLEGEFKKWPEDPNGTLVTLEQVRMGLVKLEKYGMDLIEEIVGKLPNVKIPIDELDDEGQEIQFTTRALRLYKNKSFNWLNWKQGENAGRVRFVFDDGCGEFTVPDVNKIWGEDGNPNNHNQRFYFPGRHPGQDQNNGLASVFTAPGCVARRVKIYFLDEHAIPEPVGKIHESIRYTDEMKNRRLQWYFGTKLHLGQKCKFDVVRDGKIDFTITFIVQNRMSRDTIGYDGSGGFVAKSPSESIPSGCVMLTPYSMQEKIYSRSSGILTTY